VLVDEMIHNTLREMEPGRLRLDEAERGLSLDVGAKAVVVGFYTFPKGFTSSLGRRTRDRRFFIPVETVAPPYQSNVTSYL